jgi:hypothetical protein
MIDNTDPSLGGRTWDVYRVAGVDTDLVQAYAFRQVLNGGYVEYFVTGGVCLGWTPFSRPKQASAKVEPPPLRLRSTSRGFPEATEGSLRRVSLTQERRFSRLISVTLPR